MRTDKTANGDRTVLPGTDDSKPEVKKSFRASKQPAPALPALPRKPRAATAPPPPPIPAALVVGDVVAEPFILELTIPARPESHYPFQYHYDLPPFDLPPQNLLIFQLRAGDPFRLVDDGHQSFTDADRNWPDGERVTLTIRAWRPHERPHKLALLESIAHAERGNYLLVSVAAGKPFEVLRDGQPLFAKPGVAKEGGQPE